jgi:signal peptidase I
MYYNAGNLSKREGETLEELESQSESARSPENEHVSLSQAFGGHSLLREIVETVLLTAILFLVVNGTTGRFQVRGYSMEPTLYDGQYLIVSKVIYWVHPPERGDVVVFRPPNGSSEDYIKRVIGLPGETIEIRGGTVWINGVALEEPYITAAGGDSGLRTLGDEQYFVLGDNRNNSSDSRSWGVLPRQDIIGKAWLCYWPPERWGPVTHYQFPEIEGQGE